jgi:hypothetical protein
MAEVAVDFFRWLKLPLPKRLTADELQLGNYSRVVFLPCRRVML